MYTNPGGINSQQKELNLGAIYVNKNPNNIIHRII